MNERHTRMIVVEIPVLIAAGVDVEGDDDTRFALLGWVAEAVVVGLTDLLADTGSGVRYGEDYGFDSLDLDARTCAWLRSDYQRDVASGDLADQAPEITPEPEGDDASAA